MTQRGGSRESWKEKLKFTGGEVKNRGGERGSLQGSFRTAAGFRLKSGTRRGGQKLNRKKNWEWGALPIRTTAQKKHAGTMSETSALSEKIIVSSVRGVSKGKTKKEPRRGSPL